jgi:WD40 repeat protein
MFTATPTPQTVPAFLGWNVDAPVVASAWLGGTCAVAVGDGSVRLLRTGYPTPLAVPVGSGGAVLCLTTVAGAFVAGAEDGSIVRISAEGHAEPLAKIPSFAEHVAYDSLSKTLAVASGKKLFLFGPDGTPKTLQPYVLNSSIGGIAPSPIAARLAVSGYNEVQVFSLDNLKMQPRKLLWKGVHLSLTYSPDGKWLISAMQESAIHLWRLADGLDLHMRGYMAKPLGFSWGADADTLATTGGSGVPLWNFKNKTQGPAGQQARVIAGSGNSDVVVTAVAMHPKGPFIAIGYSDGLVLLANLHDERSILLQAPPEKATPVSSLCWSEGGLSLVSGTEGGQLLLTDFEMLLNR